MPNTWSILWATCRIAILVGFAKSVSFLKELLIAKTFGTQKELDAFNIAVLLPFFIIAIIGGSITTALIPAIIKYRQANSRENINNIISNYIVIIIYSILIIDSMLYIYSGKIINVLAPGFNSETITLARSLLVILLPTILAGGVAPIFTAVLHSEQRFTITSILPVVTPILVYLVVLLASSRLGIFCVAMATSFGSLIELAILIRSVHRLGFFPALKWCGMDSGTKSAGEQCIPLIFGAVLMNSSPLIDQAMASYLGPGSVSVLGYATKIISLAITVGGMAVSTAILPHFSEMVETESWVELKKTLITFSRWLLIVTIPAAATFFMFSETVVKLLFERGNFTSSDTAIVGKTAAWLSLQLPFYLTGIIGVRLLNAMREGRSILTICAVNLSLNIAGNYFLMKLMGISGIALATSLVYFFSCLQVYFVAYRCLRVRSNQILCQARLQTTKI